MLGERSGILEKTFMGAINKIGNAAIPCRIVQMTDKERRVSMSSDVKDEIYEGPLQRGAETRFHIWTMQVHAMPSPPQAGPE